MVEAAVGAAPGQVSHVAAVGAVPRSVPVMMLVPVMAIAWNSAWWALLTALRRSSGLGAAGVSGAGDVRCLSARPDQSSVLLVLFA